MPPPNKNVFVTSDHHFGHSNICRFTLPDGSKLRPWDNCRDMDEAMAKALGIYGPLWRPNESGIYTARELSPPLRAAIHELKTYPEKYRQYDASTGWGTVGDFLAFMKRVLDGCENHPDADVEVSV